MEIRNYKQSKIQFGKLHTDASILYYAKRLSPEKQAQLELLKALSKDTPIDVFATTRKIHGTERLVAEVGTKTFKENMFRNPIKTLIKALNYAKQLSKEQHDMNILTEGMKTPRID